MGVKLQKSRCNEWKRVVKRADVSGKSEEMHFPIP